MYQYQHYPLALYKGEELLIVKDKAEEDAGRAEGYRMLSEPEPVKRKTRKAKDDNSNTDH